MKSNEESVFTEALAKADPQERAAFLDQACASDPALRDSVESLLAAYEGGSFLETPAVRPGDKLKGQTPGNSTQAEPPTDINEGCPLDFLAPSDKPGVLGRLAHYDILEIIGKGGMGIVLRGFDEQLHRVVAIKVMAAQLATNATARKRFAREAQAQAAVSHDHIVTIHAVEAESPLPYLVMQYIAGMSLQERLDKTGALQLQEILRIGMQTAAGLAAAHSQGLVHRDIKPANILLENGVERVKVTDFGLARAATEASLTQSGVVAGTPQYMSPEQAEGKAIDQRTDLFSLGSVMYAMCTGRAPFRASGSMAVLKRVCEETPTPIRESNAEIPDWLVAIIDKLHAKDPAQRYQTAAEVAEVLNQHLAHLQHPSIMPLPPPPPAKPSTPGRRRLVAATALLCIVAALALTEAIGVTNLFTTLTGKTDGPRGKVSVDAVAPAASLEASKPILLMHFDEADFYGKDGKTYVRDRSGNGHDGLCEQVQFTPKGKSGGGLANDGKGLLRLPSSLINGKSNFTIAGWVKPADLKKLWHLYAVINADYRLGDPSWEPRFTLRRAHGAYLYSSAWNSARENPWIEATSGTLNVLPGEWLFVAAALEEGGPGKGRLRLMMNDRIWERPLQQIDGPSEGFQDVAAADLEGVLDELVVWDRALSDQELQDLLALPAAIAAVKAKSLDPDRKAAEYVLSIGGTVYVNGENRGIKATDDLPPEPFRLTLVNLSNNKQVSDAGLAAFQDCKNLTRLYLGGTPVSNAGLAHFKDCKNLMFLWLHHTQVSDAGLVHFKDCSNLTGLHLAGTQVSDAGLANFKGCKKLKELDLGGTKVSDAGLAYFKDCNLMHLGFSNTQVGDAGLAHLKDCKNLTLFDLGSTRVSDGGLAYFQDCKNLTHLYLDGTQVSDEGLGHFKDCKNLMVLYLRGTQVSDAGLAHFKDGKNLTKLDLSETQVSDAGLKHLAGLKDLDSLDLRGTKATAAGVAELQKALPKCKIDWSDKGPGQK